MKKPFATCLGITLVGLALSAPAYGSYRDGAWGFFIVLYSLPVGVAATLCTLVCWRFELFRKQWFFLLYSLSAIVAALAAVGLFSTRILGSPGLQLNLSVYGLQPTRFARG